MSDPTGFFEEFSSAVRTGDATELRDYFADEQAVQRFAVYRNNVVRAAIEALRAAYPAVNRLVGADFFSPMAKAYWELDPPSRRTMTLYGAGFADHVSSYPPAASLAYLADVARLDRAWLEAHHAPDMPALDPSAVSALPPAQLPDLAPGLHPSVRLLRLDWPVYEIWRTNRFDSEPATMRLERAPAAALVWRHRGEVHHRSIPPAELAFFTSLMSGGTMAAASADATETSPEFDPAGAFGAALSQGLLQNHLQGLKTT